jgi:hypothetical protein
MEPSIAPYDCLPAYTPRRPKPANIQDMAPVPAHHDPEKDDWHYVEINDMPPLQKPAEIGHRGPQQGMWRFVETNDMPGQSSGHNRAPTVATPRQANTDIEAGTSSAPRARWGVLPVVAGVLLGVTLILTIGATAWIAAGGDGGDSHTGEKEARGLKELEQVMQGAGDAIKSGLSSVAGRYGWNNNGQGRIG